MTIARKKALAYNNYEKEVEKLEKLITRLPKYKYDETSALRECDLTERKVLASTLSYSSQSIKITCHIDSGSLEASNVVTYNK